MVVVVSLDTAWIWNTLAWIMRNESLVTLNLSSLLVYLLRINMTSAITQAIYKHG